MKFFMVLIQIEVIFWCYGLIYVDAQPHLVVKIIQIIGTVLIQRYNNQGLLALLKKYKASKILALHSF